MARGSGPNNDWNGQRLVLTPCAGRNEQIFSLVTSGTNGLYDMQRECRANGRSGVSWCAFRCEYREQWKPFWYDGVTYSCGRPDGIDGADVCVSALDPDQYPHDWNYEENLCTCECESIVGSESVGASASGSGGKRVKKWRVPLKSERGGGPATKLASSVASVTMARSATTIAATAVPTLNVRGRR
ncbi:hypothetical protein H9P43_008860 [Blastocladiella emersonii ATCC 22665]|nr:hypothetical protein H9P43_008860 [Blastocladiella emersonii ATCC 22665]